MFIYSPCTATADQGLTDLFYTNSTQEDIENGIFDGCSGLKPGLIIFRRLDVKHRNWYCRVRIPKEDAGAPDIIANPYKTISLGTSDNHEARSVARQDIIELKHEY